MTTLHKPGWYARHIAPHLPKKAFKPVPQRLWGGAAYLVITLAIAFLMGWFDLHITLNLLGAALLGACFAGLGFLGHEILHGAIVKKRWLRNFLGAVAFWPLSTGPKLWRMWHNRGHHVHTQHDDEDPDSWLSYDQVHKRRLTRLLYRIPFPIRAVIAFASLAITFSFHSTKMFIKYIKSFKREEQKSVWMQFILPWAAWIGLLFALGFEKWLYIYLIPLLIANFIVMAYISTNHRLNPLGDVNDPLVNSLSVNVPKWVDVIHFNFSHHTEHHLFPGMSAKYYPIIKQHLKEKWPDRYNEMPLGEALLALYQTPRVYFKQTELIDPNRQHVYGSLRNGLDPKNIKYRNIKNDDDSSNDTMKK
ncbi:acyl-CoA desaturase [Bacillaceae bacterium SIJ1]|uniref:fatty acid desaturase family protein n=1 Tax=Litoribacterium kuwaitense TaxID=1398745 RepID=UPI0013EBB6F5|nr:fatty acid desaturase [Litoribacterium kuwaitense]NGP44660.1 acyl-CoA desaturase [Litoribacterium kuwaitense]